MTVSFTCFHPPWTAAVAATQNRAFVKFIRAAEVGRGSASTLQQTLLIFLCQKSPERNRKRRTGWWHGTKRADISPAPFVTNHRSDPVGSHSWAYFRLNACWQAQFGGKVNKKERKMWGSALNLASVPSHTRSYATKVQWQERRYPANRQGVQVTPLMNWKTPQNCTSTFSF